jgi:hypothetical protein
MSQDDSSNEFGTHYVEKQQRERSKAGQEQEIIESRDFNASFSEGSETEKDIEAHAYRFTRLGSFSLLNSC